MNITSTEIDNLTRTPSDGKLYKCGNKYSINVNGFIISGNVGKIYKKDPKKIKTCKYTKCLKYPKCNYYHPQDDIRNYVSTKLCVDKPFLDVDCDNISDAMIYMDVDEKSQFMDRAFHNFLIMIKMMEKNK